MTVSLHLVTVGTYLQILPQIGKLIDKAEEHCRSNDLPPETVTGASLGGDMWPFAKQIFECGHHSARAIQAVRSGLAGPEIGEVPFDFASLRSEIAEALAFVRTVEPDELDAFAKRDVHFVYGDLRRDYLAEDFLLSFTLPNFFFHSMAVYAVLRSQGLEIGKLDYLGKVRLKP